MQSLLRRIEDALQRADRALACGLRWPLLLLLAVFVLKAVYVVQSADALHVRVPIMDSRYYDEMAQDLARGHLVRHEAFFMGPLYPYLLALVYSVFGRDFMVVRLLQALGGALTVVLVFLIGRRVFRPSAAFAGAALLALYGAMTFYETQLLMEWLGTLLNCLAIYLLISAGDEVTPRRAALAGLTIGLSALARASILFFAVFVALWLFRAAPRRRAVWRVAAFSGALVAALLPAMIHNYAASHVFAPVTTNAGVNFYVGNSSQANGTFVPIRDVDLIDDVTTRTYVEQMTGRQMSPSQVSSFWLARAWNDMRAAPARTAKLLAIKTALFFNGYEVPQIESFDVELREQPWLRVLFVRLWLIMLLGALGMLLAARAPRGRGVLYGYVFFYALSIIIFFVTGRYRAQVTPILCLFAGSALVALPGYARSFRSGAGIAGALVLLGLATSPRLFAIDEHMIEFREQVRRGRRLSELHSYQPALREVDKAIAIYPREPEGYVHRAIIHRENNNDFKAIEDYNRALEIDPAQPAVHYDLAQALRRVNLMEEATREYRLAVQYDPRMLQAYNNLGIAYREMRRYDDAVTAFRKVIELSPAYVKAYNNLGASYAEMGRMDEAIDVFAETTLRFPEYANGFKNLAMAYAAQRKPRPALEAMRRYVELNPADAGAKDLVRKLEIAARADTSNVN
ncbi:MAG TPA: tetratricopeptide repeat protein [Candidatus Krumholzibacteria bacterium]|nr:tetratricopeptide repeat protein [Candidatus Krumholzibacteria bacterium]